MEHEPLSSLRRHPHLAEKVGLVIADYAVLEMSFYFIYSAINYYNLENSFKEFYGLRSLNLRCELVLNKFDENTQFPPSYRKALERLIRRFKSAANRRTEIAHVQYLEKNNKIISLFLKGEDPSFREINGSLFNRTFSQYRKLNIDLGVFLSHIVRTLEELTQILSSTPHARNLDTALSDFLNQAPQVKSRETELEESRKRLGLPPFFVASSMQAN
jgi:hypothetical protein